MDYLIAIIGILFLFFYGAGLIISCKTNSRFDAVAPVPPTKKKGKKNAV
jgi:hypothetical protein